jgi:4-amino-4-deoxy-L-arabinose transferase-like glycosyltransferase
MGEGDLEMVGATGEEVQDLSPEAPRSRSISELSRRPHALVVVILVVAGLLRLGVLLVRSSRTSRFLTPDSYGYLTLSKDLHAFASSSDPNFALGLLRTPVYPLYLTATESITDSHILGPMIVQLIIGVGVVYLTYRLGLSLFGRSVALCAAAVLAVDPLSIVYSSLMITEVLFTVFLVGSVLLLWRPDDNRWTRGLAAGVLLGLATLTRPVSMYLSVALAVGYLVLERRHVKNAAVVALSFLIGFGALTGAWVIRNDVIGGVATISTIEGYNLLYYRAVGALEESKNVPLVEAQKEMTQQLQAKLPPHATPGQIDKTEQSLGETVIRNHVSGFAKETAKGGARLLLGPGGDEFGPATGGHATDLLTAYSIVYLVALYALVVVGLWSAWRLHRLRSCVMPLIVIVYLVLISSGLDAYSRLRVPIMPFLALLAGVGVLALSKRNPDGGQLSRSSPMRTETPSSKSDGQDVDDDHQRLTSQ